MGPNPIKKAYRQQGRQTKRTVRATVKDMKAEAKTFAKGARLKGRGETLMARTQTQSSKEVSRMRKKGEVRRGPAKSTRYRAMDAQVKMDWGQKMMDSPGSYTKRTIKRGAERTAPTSGLKSGRTTLNRRGKAIKRK